MMRLKVMLMKLTDRRFGGDGGAGALVVDFRAELGFRVFQDLFLRKSEPEVLQAT